MSDDEHEDLDTLTCAELAELDGPAYPVASVLDEWNHRHNGVTSSTHGAGLFLDLLAAEGWRVEPIVVPTMDELLAPRVAAPVAMVEFPAAWTDEQIARFKHAWAEQGGGPVEYKRAGEDDDA